MLYFASTKAAAVAAAAAAFAVAKFEAVFVRHIQTYNYMHDYQINT